VGLSIAVGLGEVKVSRADDDVIVALGLGSCIAICAYDHEAGVAGIAHVVLPESSTANADTPGKFADTAVPALVNHMRTLGASPNRLSVAIAGGAAVFSFGGTSPRLDVGVRNAAAVEDALRKGGLRVVARDVGGKTGRTVRLMVGTGEIRVKTIGQGERELTYLGARRTMPLARAA